MGLLEQQRKDISNLLISQIRRKLAAYKPQTNKMPFQARLFGKDRMALYSFIQSINTTLGTSVFEQIAVIIAKPHFKRVECQYKNLNNTISTLAQSTIQNFIDDLINARKYPNKLKEIEEVLKVAQIGSLKSVKRPRIDVFLEKYDGTEYYFDLKTAKPNIHNCVDFKRTLLEWVAMRGAQNPQVKIHTLLGIPYNPYEPEPYRRWILPGLFEISEEIMVAEEFWNFLGGINTYEEVLDVFEKAGITLRPEIDRKFNSLEPPLQLDL